MESIAQRWAAAWSSHHPARLAALFDTDCVYDDVAFGVASHGREGVLEWARGFLASFPDLVVEVDTSFRHADRAALEWRMRGTHTGEFAGAAPTGRRFEVRGVTILVLRDERIVRCSDYWDLRGVLDQLGA